MGDAAQPLGVATASDAGEKHWQDASGTRKKEERMVRTADPTKDWLDQGLVLIGKRTAEPLASAVAAEDVIGICSDPKLMSNTFS